MEEILLDYWKENNPYGGIPKYMGLTDEHNLIIQMLMDLYPEIDEKFNVLDIGGGPSLHATMLAMNKKCLCFNIENSDLCQNVTEESLIDFIKQDIRFGGWPIISELMDFCYSIQTLEHVEEEYILHILEETFRSLKTGGNFFLSVAQEHLDEDPDHKTLKPRGWWMEKAACTGFLINPTKQKQYDGMDHKFKNEWQTFCLVKIEKEKKEDDSCGTYEKIGGS